MKCQTNKCREIFNHNFLLFCSVTAVCIYYCASYVHVTLDDAFIYYRVVANLLETGKPEFNIGDNCLIVTSPLWTFLLASGKIILPFFDIVTIAKIFWIVLLAVASLFAYWTFLPYVKNWACFTGIPFFLSPVICSMVGSEIALLYAAMFLTFWAYIHNRPVWVGIGLGAGYLARGEFVFIFLPIFIHYVLTAYIKKKAPNKQVFTYLLKIGVTALSIALVWHLYYVLIFDNFFPQTLSTKMIQGQSGQWVLYHQRLWPYIKELLGGRVYLLVFALIGMVRQPYLFLLMGGYTGLHFGAYYILKVPDYHWYCYDFFLFTLLFMFFGIFYIFDISARAFISRLNEPNVSKRGNVRRCAMGVFLLFILWFFPVHLHVFFPGGVNDDCSAKDLKRESRLFKQEERYNSYLKLSQRLQTDLHENDVILTPEIGIISYYLLNYEVRDVNGLASAISSVADMNNYHYFIDHYKPRFLICPWLKDKELLRFRYNKKTYVYKKYFVADPHAQFHPGTVYILSGQT